EPRRRARAIAGDIFVGRHAEHIETHAQADVLRRLQAQAAGDQALRLHDVGGLVHAGLNVGAHEVHRGPWLVGDELVALEVDAPAVRLADVDPCRAGEIAEMRAVPGRHLAPISGADQTAGAVQVLYHH